MQHNDGFAVTFAEPEIPRHGAQFLARIVQGRRTGLHVAISTLATSLLPMPP
jgi:hypothetical protein